jgi:zinc protease
MMRTLFILIVTLFTPTVLAQAPAISDPFDFESSDGVSAVLVADHRVPIVQIALMFPVGSHNAWFVENHGAEAFTLQNMDPDGSLRARANELAVSVDFAVGDHACIVSARGLREDIQEMKQLLVDILANDAVDKSEIKRAAQGSKVDWSSRQKDADFVLHTAMAEVLYDSTDPRMMAYQQPSALTRDPAVLLSVRDEIIRLPGRQIGFSGDLTLTEAVDLSMALLPAATNDERVTVQYPALRRARPPLQEIELADLNQVYLAFTGEAPAVHDPQFPAFMLAREVLGGHFHSRLYKALRHDEGDTYGARAEVSVGTAPGMVALTTFSRLDNATKIEGKLREVLARFHTQGITEEELRNAKLNWTGSQAFERQSPHNVLRTLMWSRAEGLADDHEATLVAAAQALTLPQVNKVISVLFQPEAFTMVRLVAE